MKYKLIRAFIIALCAVELYVSKGAMTVQATEVIQKNTDIQTDGILNGTEQKKTPETIHIVNEGAAKDTVLMSGGVQAYLMGMKKDFDETVQMASTPMPLTDDAVISEEEISESEHGAENEYADLALAKVTKYVNVRSEATTNSNIVGKIYNGAVAQILETVDGEDGQWFKIISGNVEGYIKSEFFLYGDAAAEAIDDYVTRYAVVLADRLNVREKQDIESKRIGYINNGEKVKIEENLGDWLKVQYTGTKTGYVAAEYVTISEEFVYAKTLEEEAAEIAARKKLEERQRETEAQASENTNISVTPPAGNYTTNTELRTGIVDYAMQFLGNKYVHGGRSLVTGTDCSGFTSLIYAEFGYSVSRTPEGQLANNGRSIAYSEAQSGDIICYGSGSKCTHVALYIGDGKIIHSANSRKGVVIYNADYDTIIGVKNIID